MTCATTRSTTPAAAPRTARRAAALPNDPGLDDILADPNLSSTAKAIITVMIRNWAWVKDHCWPSDATLAARVGKSVGHVQRCLRELELAGRIRRERPPRSPTAGGSGCSGAAPATAPCAAGPRAGAHCPPRAGARRTNRHREREKGTRNSARLTTTTRGRPGPDRRPRRAAPRGAGLPGGGAARAPRTASDGPGGP